MPFDILGIENPLIDLLVRVPDSFLEEAGIEKNRTFLVDRERQAALLDALQGLPAQMEAGGSCANTMVGIAQLGGRVAYCGKVGDDEYGRAYLELLREAGVLPFVRADGSMTGSTVILVTPDAARTMNTHLGACQELTAADLPLEALKDSRRLYLTGYVWDTPSQ
ncbi:MAG TPA: adenosine kinase, partial [bacterium]|nr:adenosine kinase [bacterium]